MGSEEGYATLPSKRCAVYRSKTGFGVPLRKWIVQALHYPVRDLLSPHDCGRKDSSMLPQCRRWWSKMRRGEVTTHTSCMFCLHCNFGSRHLLTDRESK